MRRRRRRCARRCGRCSTIRRNIRTSRGCPCCARGWRGTMRSSTRLRCRRTASSSTMGSSSGFILAFHGAFAPGAKIAVTRPGYPAYLNTLLGIGFVPVEIPVTAANGWHLTAADDRGGLRAGDVRRAAAGVAGEPDGSGADTGATGRNRGSVRKAGRAVYLGRDLSRARLSRSVGERARVHARRDRHQQLQQILLHDRLADRLDGAARRMCCAAPRCCSRTSSSRRRR